MQKILYLYFIDYPKVFHRLPLEEILEELEKLDLLGNGIRIIYEHSVEKKHHASGQTKSLRNIQKKKDDDNKETEITIRESRQGKDEKGTNYSL